MGTSMLMLLSEAESLSTDGEQYPRNIPAPSMLPMPGCIDYNSTPIPHFPEFSTLLKSIPEDNDIKEAQGQDEIQSPLVDAARRYCKIQI